MKAINCLSWECLAIAPSALMAQTTNSQPNIVLILADDMGRECLGCYGSTYHTPNLDRLSETGVRFDNCFSQPLSTPSCVQLMTGKYNNKNYSLFRHLNQKENSRKKLEKLFLNIPAWKVGDPAVPMCILPEFPLLQTPKDMSLDQILRSY